MTLLGGGIVSLIRQIRKSIRKCFLKVKFRIVQRLNDDVATGSGDIKYQHQSEILAASVQRERRLNPGFKIPK